MNCLYILYGRYMVLLCRHSFCLLQRLEYVFDRVHLYLCVIIHHFLRVFFLFLFHSPVLHYVTTKSVSLDSKLGVNSPTVNSSLDLLHSHRDPFEGPWTSLSPQLSLFAYYSRHSESKVPNFIPIITAGPFHEYT